MRCRGWRRLGFSQIGQVIRDVVDRSAGDALVQAGAQIADRPLVDQARQVDLPLLDPAGVGDQHEHQPGVAQLDQLEVPHRRAVEDRVLDDGDVTRQLGEQPDGSRHHVVEVERAVEELLDRAALGTAQRLDGREPVDEQPVALVGRHPAGTGVGLGDVALFLQRRHVVAHGRGRDPEVVPLDQGLEPTGSLVDTKSWTMARSTSSLRSSSTRTTSLDGQGPVWHSFGPSASVRRKTLRHRNDVACV